MSEYITKTILTSTSGKVYEVQSYEGINIDYSFTSKVNKFTLNLSVFDESELKKYGVGATINIYGSDSLTSWDGVSDLSPYLLFKGLITENPKTLNGISKNYSITGYSSTYLLQTILVNESYEEKPVNEIISDLVSKYAGEHCTLGYIEEITFPLTITFKDTYLYTALERISDATNCTFEITNQDVFRFQSIFSKTSDIPILIDDYEKGSANFSYSESQLVNRLKVYGGYTLSPDIKQTFKPTADGNSTFLLNHKPRASSFGSVMVELDHWSLPTMPEDLHEEGDGAEVLINYNDQTIRFITTTIGEDGKVDETDRLIPSTSLIEVTYRREDKLALLLTDDASIQTYGVKDSYISFADITDRNALIERGQTYLNKYSKPILSGSLNTWKNDHNVGEQVEIQILTDEGYFVNDWLTLSSKTMSIAGGFLKNSYKFEEQKTLMDVMKNLLERLEALEKDNQEGDSVQQIDYINEGLTIIDTNKRTTTNNRFRVGIGVIGESVL